MGQLSAALQPKERSSRVLGRALRVGSGPSWVSQRSFNHQSPTPPSLFCTFWEGGEGCSPPAPNPQSLLPAMSR